MGKILDVIKSVTSKLYSLWVKRNNESYIKYLKHIGIVIGENVHFRGPSSTRIDVSRPALIKIGNNVDINTNFQMLTHDWCSFVFRLKYADFINSSGKIVLGNNIYIGTNVTILKGVTVGDNVIIGANSLVTRDIQSNTVAAGCPCKVICSIDEYYKKRKKDGLKEAVEYVNCYYQRFNRYPTPSELTEEFIYFVDCRNQSKYEADGIPVRKQLNTAYEKWIDSHHSLFSSYEEFIRFCINENQLQC